MNRNIRFATILSAALLCTACAGMSSSEKSTAVGAAAGAVVGNVLTGGGVLGTLGGAAAGGIIGHEVNKRGK